MIAEGCWHETGAAGGRTLAHEAIMSKAIHRAPLALASDGTVLLNVAMFDVDATPTA
jgi:hypothetical protein